MLRRIFRLAPVRLCLLGAGLCWLGIFFVFRGSRSFANALTFGLARPFQETVSGWCDAMPFSVGEVLYTLVLLAFLVWLILSLIGLIRGPDRRARLFRLCVGTITAAALAYGAYCLLWGIQYYADDFSDRSGIQAEGVSVEALTQVTEAFADLAAAYSPYIARDGNGLFAETGYLDRAETLYDAAAASYPCLDGPARRPKEMLYSEFMRRIGFTGFFCPFTGEANVSTCEPEAYRPATIAHELAHQRGVAAEDEANFVAVLACLEDGDPVYVYSAALLAFTHLSNALYSADYAAWLDVWAGLEPGVEADIRYSSAYWRAYDGTAASVSQTVYSGFLQVQGQSLGIRSYGACVDLLVSYYWEKELPKP
jgi:hypothetical protein